MLNDFLRTTAPAMRAVKEACGGVEETAKQIARTRFKVALMTFEEQSTKGDIKAGFETYADGIRVAEQKVAHAGVIMSDEEKKEKFFAGFITRALLNGTLSKRSGCSLIIPSMISSRAEHSSGAIYDDSERTGKQIEREPGLQPENWRAPTRELEGANPRTGGHQPRRTGERAPTP